MIHVETEKDPSPTTTTTTTAAAAAAATYWKLLLGVESPGLKTNRRL